jgi:hypothetical protein
MPNSKTNAVILLVIKTEETAIIGDNQERVTLLTDRSPAF